MRETGDGRGGDSRHARRSRDLRGDFLIAGDAYVETRRVRARDDIPAPNLFRQRR